MVVLTSAWPSSCCTVQTCTSTWVRTTGMRLCGTGRPSCCSHGMSMRAPRGRERAARSAPGDASRRRRAARWRASTRTPEPPRRPSCADDAGLRPSARSRAPNRRTSPRCVSCSACTASVRGGHRAGAVPQEASRCCVHFPPRSARRLRPLSPSQKYCTFIQYPPRSRLSIHSPGRPPRRPSTFTHRSRRRRWTVVCHRYQVRPPGPSCSLPH